MASHKILVVDDSAVGLEHLCHIVEEAGHQTLTASSGREAQNQALHHHPDLILMDVVMNDIDGFEACRNISRHARTCKIPIVFVTSKNQKADQVWGELQGGRGMISKPFSREDILETINEINPS